jgi:hypothetical protein
VCIVLFLKKLIYLFFTFLDVYVHLHLPFCLNILSFFLGDWSVVHNSLATPPFQKVCGNCHVADATISPASGVYFNICCSKSMVQKLGFIRGSITTNDEHVLLTIEGKWLEGIVHMTEFKFLDLPHHMFNAL